MTDEEISTYLHKQLFREGLHSEKENIAMILSTIQRVRAEEREACAREAEKYPREPWPSYIDKPIIRIWETAGKDIGRIIRARGSEK
jgi:hypothetical protein